MRRQRPPRRRCLRLPVLQAASISFATKENLMTELDLNDINPLNWERARARARAVQAYIDLPKRSGVERDRFAAKLGISPNLFSRLVAAWRSGKGMN
jgi:hypothetical protein